MHRRGRTIWAERALVVLFLASLAGTLNLVITVHRKAGVKANVAGPVAPATEAAPVDSPVKTTPAAEPAGEVVPPAVVASKTKSPAPVSRPAPLPEPEDPTKKALTALAAATARELAEAEQADRRAGSLEQARLEAVAESKRWRRREMLVKQQVAALDEQARKIDRQLDSLVAERDVLVAERDGLKAAVAKAQQGKGSYAVLPYKGENGTWRRPIVLECANGTVTLLPKGPTFSLLDLSSMIYPRTSPVILALARELMRVQMSESPDGAPVVPYFVFLVRPDGIRPYYEIRARLERLGIAFGYELIEQNLKVQVPDFDNLATWDGTIPLEEPILAAPRTQVAGVTTNRGDGDGNGDGLSWPSTGGEGSAAKGGSRSQLAGSPGIVKRDRGTGGGSPDDFVWHAESGGGGSRGSPGSGGSAGSSGGPGGIGRAQGVGSGGPSNALALGGNGDKTGPGAGGASGSFKAPASGGDGLGWLGSDSTRESATAGQMSGSGVGRDKAGTNGTGTGNRGNGTGSKLGAGGERALARWPFPYPPPGTGLADDSDETGNGAGTGGASGRGGVNLPGIRRGSPGTGTGSGGDAQGKDVALLPDLEPASDEKGQAGAGGSGGQLFGPTGG
ncbi:MAG: hypothetical protein ACP5XB_13585, partial [Isosphaeraceae bacterium]